MDCEIVEKYARRFNGITIDLRGTDCIGWEKQWRLKRHVSKNERGEYRITKYFDSFDELITFITAPKQLKVGDKAFYEHGTSMGTFLTECLIINKSEEQYKISFLDEISEKNDIRWVDKDEVSNQFQT